jgi:hypothetical protein
MPSLRTSICLCGSSRPGARPSRAKFATEPQQEPRFDCEPNTLVVGGVPTGICSRVSVERPGGGVAVPGKPPAPLTESEPEPLHGRPVIGLVPVALPPMAAVEPGSVPGLIGETGGSAISGRLNSVLGFCAKSSAGGLLSSRRRAAGELFVGPIAA